MMKPITVSGSNSKVLEVELPPGRYLLSWSREGRGYFAVRDEMERQGKGANLLSAISSHPNSGEKIVRIEESGPHLLSVDGNNLNWTLKFEPT